MSSPGHRPSGAIADRAIVRQVHPEILAAIISLFPFTIYSTFVVAIAEGAGEQESVVGALRGVGGVAAILAGVSLAPLLGRIPGRSAAAVGLALLSLTCAIGSLGTTPALWVFCLGIGASTAVLTPVLLTSAAGSFAGPGDAARAATIVTAAQSLAAVMAGPVIGLMSRWQGWQGALWITAASALVIGLLGLRVPPSRRGETGPARPPGYLRAFAVVVARPQLLALIAVAGLRTTSFMGYLAFLAVHFHRAFAIDAATFTLVWSLSGASFFAANYLAGRWARRAADSPGAVRALILTGLLPALAAVLVVFTTSDLVVALAATVVMGFGHAMIAAQVTTLVTRRSGDQAATVFSLNGAAMSVGVFAGAGLGGLGLHLGGTPGIGVALAVPMVIAAVLLPLAVPRTGTDTVIDPPEERSGR